MLCSLWTDLIVVKFECGECLCETKSMSDWMKRQGCYIVLLETSGKMLCSFITNPIGGEVQCGECLRETKRMRDGMKRQGCYIVLLESSSKMLCSFIIDLIVAEVECGECLCETKENERWDEKVGMLHCFVEEQWQDVVLLQHRSDCC